MWIINAKERLRRFFAPLIFCCVCGPISTVCGLKFIGNLFIDCKSKKSNKKKTISRSLFSVLITLQIITDLNFEKMWFEFLYSHYFPFLYETAWLFAIRKGNRKQQQKKIYLKEAKKKKWIYSNAVKHDVWTARLRVHKFSLSRFYLNFSHSVNV